MPGLGATRGWDLGAGGARPRRVVQSPSLHPLLLPAQHWETGSSCPSITGTTGGDKAAAGQLLGNWATSLKLFKFFSLPFSSKPSWIRWAIRPVARGAGSTALPHSGTPQHLRSQGSISAPPQPRLSRPADLAQGFWVTPHPVASREPAKPMGMLGGQAPEVLMQGTSLGCGHQHRLGWRRHTLEERAQATRMGLKQNTRQGEPGALPQGTGCSPPCSHL